MELRVDGRDFDLRGGEYIKQVIRDQHPEIWIPKAAQTRFTITAIVKSLHYVTERRLHGLYLLPLKTGAIPFVQARIDPIIESRPALEKKFGSVDNRLHKQTVERINLYVRGTNIDRELQEVPVDFEVWDERDRMVEENLSDARHRMDGSKFQRLLVISTPTVDGYGVYGEDGWQQTDQNRWEVPCPGCGRFQVLNFDEPSLDYASLKLGDTADECVLECSYCRREIRDEERPGLNSLGRWTAFAPDGKLRGYHISQFNSPTQRLAEIMKDYFDGQKDLRKLRSFWNQNMGRPYTAAGDRITPELLDKCRRNGYSVGGLPNSSLAIGIDIGTLIHVWCWHFTPNRQQKMLWNIKLMRTWDELTKFLEGLSGFVAVVDAQPEKTKATELAKRFPGKIWVAFTDDRYAANEMAVFEKVKYGVAPKVLIDKPMACDTFIADYLNGSVILPFEAREMGEPMPKKPYNGFYYQQVQMVRVEEENTRGIIVGRWKKNNNADHWHHAGFMATVAALRAPTLSVPALLSNAMNKGGVIAS